MVRLTRSKIVTFSAAALLVAGVVAVAVAQGPGGRRGPMGQRGMGGPGFGFGDPGGLPLGQLDLSDAQRSQVRDIREKYAQDLRKSGEQVRAGHQAQREAIETYPINESLVRSTTQGLASALTDMALIQAQMHHDLFSILTPDQQAKAQQLDQERESRMKERQQQMQQRMQQRRQRR